MKRLCAPLLAPAPVLTLALALALTTVLTLALTLAQPALAQVSDLRSTAMPPSTTGGVKPAPKAGKTATDYMREGRSPRPAVKVAKPGAAAKTPASLQ